MARMVYVNRNQAGEIRGVFARKQYDGQERISDDDASVVAFYNRINASEDTVNEASARLKASNLADKTYEQVEAYIDANVTDFASAKQFMKQHAEITLAILKYLKRSA